jgi:hypothetical protein
LKKSPQTFCWWFFTGRGFLFSGDGKTFSFGKNPNLQAKETT